jgi:hypothetical protein
MKQSRKRKARERYYCTFITTHRGYQVLRHFLVDHKAAKNSYAVTDVWEVVQDWFDSNGNEAVVARMTAYHPTYCDLWCIDKPMDLRAASGKHRIWADYIAPGTRLIPKLRRNGYTNRATKHMPPGELMKKLLTDPEVEMLVKTKQYGILRYLKYEREMQIKDTVFEHAIRICNRNGYRPTDGQMWADYIRIIEDEGKDTHNAHYVCPKDLKAAHDAAHKQHERLLEKRREEQQRADAAKWEQQYQVDKRAYLGICFGNEDIVVTVLQSVADFAEEGKAMHHCVFSAGYYKRADCLILTARAKSDGERIETIEVSLKTFEVVQSRAKFNRNSPQHDEILQLMHDNMALIRRAS